MEILLIAAAGLAYGLCLLWAYKKGLDDGCDKSVSKVALKPFKKIEAKPTTEEEKKAADRQRRIDEFRG